MTEASLVRRRSGLLCDKILRRHQDRLAIVYVRQSTVQQVERHQESTRLQYALADRAAQYGWGGEQIVVNEDDPGRSGQRRGPLGLSAARRRSRPRQCRSRARHRDVALGALLPRLASASGNLRAVRYADRRRRWGV